jgi:hypothetical protein
LLTVYCKLFSTSLCEQFIDNVGYRGGAVAAKDASTNLLSAVSDAQPGAVQLERCLFLRNEALSTGGAVFLDTGRRADIVNCSADQNIAGWGGGAYYAAPTTILTISDSSLTSNAALTTLGGGIFTIGKLSVADTVFTNNSAAASGIARVSTVQQYCVSFCI